MSMGTVIILSAVAAIIAALVLAPPVAPPRAGGRPRGPDPGREAYADRYRSADGPRFRGRLRKVPEPRSGRYRRTAG